MTSVLTEVQKKKLIIPKPSWRTILTDYAGRAKGHHGSLVEWYSFCAAQAKKSGSPSRLYAVVGEGEFLNNDPSAAELLETVLEMAAPQDKSRSPIEVIAMFDASSGGNLEISRITSELERRGYGSFIALLCQDFRFENHFAVYGQYVFNEVTHEATRPLKQRRGLVSSNSTIFLGESRQTWNTVLAKYDIRRIQ